MQSHMSKFSLLASNEAVECCSRGMCRHPHYQGAASTGTSDHQKAPEHIWNTTDVP